MRLKVCFVPPLGVFVSLGVVLAQSPEAESVRRAHGGAALERLVQYQARGAADTPQGRLEFTLKISGDRSRLEVGDRVFVRQGAIGRWRSSTGRWSGAGRVWEGMRDVYLLPPFAVGELGRFARRPEGPGWAFRRVVPRRSHIGFQAPRPVVDLEFDPATGLLSESVFGDEAGGRSEVRVRYSAYRPVEGVPLPGLVSRQTGDGPVWTFRFDSFDFQPSFAAGDFDLGP